MDILVDCCQENPADVATACSQFRMPWKVFHTAWRTIIHHSGYTWCIDMIWYDMIWYDMIWYDMIWYDMIWYDMIWYDMIWYDIRYDMIWYDMIWYDMHFSHCVSKVVCQNVCCLETQEEFDAMTSENTAEMVWQQMKTNLQELIQ